MTLILSKAELVERVKLAKSRIRILGVLPFNFQWDDFRKDWRSKINEGSLSVEIICEAAHFVNSQSIIASDKRISGEKRGYDLGSFLNILAAPVRLRKYLVDGKCKNLEPIGDIPITERSGYKQCFSLRTCYLQIPISAINIDNEYFITYSLTRFCDLDKFERVDDNHEWYDEFMKYFAAYFDNEHGALKYSTEITNKGNRLEVIQSFDEKRTPTGLLPRDSFLNTVQVKLVVWALLFTRDGRLLIHKRKENAKDNQGMWDKSVGGHVALSDIDTAKAVARELAEELYVQEAFDQGDHGKIDFIKSNADKMIFLGEWLPERRDIIPFEDVNSRMDEFYYFRMNYPFSTVARNSIRVIPNGIEEEKEQDVYVFADVYVCIASIQFDPSKLKNSEFRILDLFELKDAFNEGTFADGTQFRASPDLKSIIKSALWNDLTSFSDYVKESYGEKIG